jgi:H+-transporting ATPase
MDNQINPYDAKTITDVLSEFKVNAETGLGDADVEERRKTYGLNEVPEEKQSMVLVFLKHFWGLTAIMLELTIAVSFFLRKYADAWLISGLMLFNAIISFIQERKAAKTVQAIRKDLQVSARILRDGKWSQVRSNELVPGDVVRIRTGDFITADAKIIQGSAGADQSSLTGESKLIGKNAGRILYAGSVIKNGECTAVVVATGIKTFFGKTALLVQKAKPRLHMEEVVSKVVKILFSIVFTFLSVTVIISLFHGEAFITIVPLILILLISAVPVALPAMFTVSMAQGSRLLAQKGILVSRLSATEDAATLTTLCIDKTGTLTENKLAVHQVVTAETFSEDEVILYAAMASVAANSDPIDMAFFQKAAEDKIELTGYEQLSFTPFLAAIKRTEALVQKNGKEYRIFKGAYQTIKALCHTGAKSYDDVVANWAAKGYKTIAVAITRDEVVTLAGIVALIDPPLPDSAEMIVRIKELGIKVKMLTGDALPIAREIATRVGIGDRIVEASIFRHEPGTPGADQIITRHDGFAEVLPEDKYNIVKTLQNHREIIGMTGDGVNDAPALKQAEVGIAVKSATDVAKQAASVILLHEGLESMISLITVGRTIHHRITNWVVSKISKTLFTVIFVCIAYIITGKFIVGAFDMVLLLFIIDFVTLTLSTDSVSWSRRPESWEISPLVKSGLVLGILNITEALLWLFIGKSYFKITELSQLHSFGFSILFFTGIFNILLIRTPLRFFKQPISKTLLYTVIADVAVVFIILAAGLPGFSSLPVLVIGSTAAYLMFCSFFINDLLKTIATAINH